MKHHIAGAVISALLHLGFLLSIFAGANTISLSTQNQPIPLQLSVFAPPAITAPDPKPETVAKVDPQPITPKVKKPKPKPKPKPEPKPEPEPEPKKSSEQKPPKPQPVSSPQPQVVAFGINDAERLYDDSLNQALKRSKNYPRRARRMRKEGQVKVSFTIHRSGAISDVHIIDSSGSPILDKAAIRAVEKIDGLLPFPKEMKQVTLSKNVPFNFILN